MREEMSLPLPLGAVSRVDIPVSLVEQFGNGNDAVALFGSLSNYLRQRIGCILAVIMKKDNGAWVETACDAPNHLLLADIFPVQGIDAPLDGKIVKFTGRLNDFVAVFAEGRPKEIGWDSRKVGQCGVKPFQFKLDTLFVKRVQMGMSPSVIAQFVASGRDFFY